MGGISHNFFRYNEILVENFLTFRGQNDIITS